MNGGLPSFELPGGGIHEVEQLRRALQFMIEQVKTAQESEMNYRNALTESQENERIRIAREIHDDTIQSLVLVGHDIERATHTISAKEEVVASHLKNARTQLVMAIEGLRQMIANLRPIVLDELGLVVAIEMLCENEPALLFTVSGKVYELDHAQELTLFRAAQEAIRNAKRHAHAKRIIVTLRYSTDNVKLEVSDDGSGFQLPRQIQEFATGGHYGLMGLQERILHLGGHFNLVSELACGTHLTVTLPVIHKIREVA
jgi:signal transduction histidine kinase